MRCSLRRLSAAVALLAFAASFGLPFLAPTHAWIDDPDAGWSGLPRIAAAEAQLGTSTSSREEHCAICHWMRALGTSMVGLHARRADLVAPRPRLIERARLLASAPADTGPARAPPAFIA